MKRFAAKLTLLILVAAVVVLGVRLAVVASGTKTGWESITLTWRNAALSWLGLGYTPIGDRDPVEQAKFWNEETKRIVEKHPHNARLTMAAALVLDSPCEGFRRKGEFLQVNYEVTPPVVRQRYYRIVAADEAFEQACRHQCLSMAARATELEPHNVDWRRMQALLQFRSTELIFSNPRSSTALAIVEQCARRDSGNALYDYLTVLHEGPKASLMVYPPVVWSRNFLRIEVAPRNYLKIKDAALYRQMVDRFQRGQQKEFVAFGRAGLPALKEFLQHSRLTKLEQADVAIHRSTGIPYMMFTNGLIQWLNDCTKPAEYFQIEAYDQKQLAILRRQTLRIKHQVAAPERTPMAYLFVDGQARRQGFQEIVKFHQSQQGSIPASEMKRLVENEQFLRPHEKVFEIAFAKQLRERLAAGRDREFFVIASTAAAIATAVLLYIALVMFILGLCLNRQRRPPLSPGFFRYVLTGIVVSGCVFAVFGMAPAETISHDVQKRTMIGFIWLTAAGIAISVLYRVFLFLRRRKFQFSLRSLLLLTLVCGLVLASWPLISLAIDGLNEDPPMLPLYPHGTPEMYRNFLWDFVLFPTGSWRCAVSQYAAYGGPWMSAFASVFVVAFFFAWRRESRNRQSFLNYWTSDVKSRYGELARCLCRSALIMALCWLVAYLALAPPAVLGKEDDYHYKMSWICESPQHSWDIRTLCEEVRASPAQMQLIHSQVEQELNADLQPKVDSSE